MTVTNPWLAGPAPTKRLDRQALEERILNLLSSQNVCVLATIGPDGPLATPVRYFHIGFTIIFTADPRSPKMRNLRSDPRVSVGVVAPLVGQPSSRGAQLFGGASILAPGQAEHADYWQAVRWQSSWRNESSTPNTGSVAPAMRPVSIGAPRRRRDRWLCCVNASDWEAPTQARRDQDREHLTSGFRALRHSRSWSAPATDRDHAKSNGPSGVSSILPA